jgi:hypothetical protein
MIITYNTTCCIITGLFISLKKHCENVSEKEPIFADEGATARALLKNTNAEKYHMILELRLSTVSSYFLSKTVLNTIVFLYFGF